MILIILEFKLRYNQFDYLIWISDFNYRMLIAEKVSIGDSLRILIDTVGNVLKSFVLILVKVVTSSSTIV